MVYPTPMLARRIEEAAMNAWPAPQQMLMDGWLLRFGGGYTRRANCVAPLYPSNQPHAPKITTCEALYAAHSIPVVFRIPSIAVRDGLEESLAQSAYTIVSPTRILVRAIDAELVRSPNEFHVEQMAVEPWASIHAKMAGLSNHALAAHQAILRQIVPAAYPICFRDGSAILACGLAVAEAPLVGLFDLVVDPGYRRRGLGTALVRALTAWGQQQAAEYVYLQQVETNTAAAALYEGMGFWELYRYRYWAKLGGS